MKWRREKVLREALKRNLNPKQLIDFLRRQCSQSPGHERGFSLKPGGKTVPGGMQISRWISSRWAGRRSLLAHATAALTAMSGCVRGLETTMANPMKRR